jgi:phospholipid transport system substrate-binding protein
MENRPNARPVGLKSLALCVLVLCSVPAVGRADTCAPPDAAAAEAFVRDLHDGASKILLRSKSPVADMIAFISKNVEIEWVARSAMGPAWNSATPEQRADYVTLFRTTTLRTLASHLAVYDGAAYRIAQAQSVGGDEFLVTSTIVSAGGGSFGLAWRVAARGCGLTARDVVNGGVSLVVAKRQEFASVIARDGIDGLVRRLRGLEARQRTGVRSATDGGEEVLVDLVLRVAEKLGASRY